ncbi:MAG: metallophosphoesterase [Methanosarcinaceae archaeon]|nr:metallophosphoesterase [Methanosarcinaceae archaeon]MDD4497434.1 metallophosphoesterase [Methanosarcinaceae archaeon]
MNPKKNSENSENSEKRKKEAPLLSPAEILNKEAAKQALLALLPEVDSLFRAEPAVLRPEANPFLLIGDIHGDLEALELILEKRDEMGVEHMLFLGDYVDRGPRGVEVLIELFRLKLRDPDKILLLRGNHETVDMNLYYGFFQETGFDEQFLRKITRTFELMPVAAVLRGGTFCVHGGLPGPELVENISKEMPFPYLWNDPSERPGLTPSSRGKTVNEFGPDVVEEFLQLNGLEKIVRGHTALVMGYEWWFWDKLLSLFSCPDYVGLKNRGAFALHMEGKIEIISFDHSAFGNPTTR